ncbi:HAD-like protein [Martensiomyces pterosporus]|nr:HAD-like protein [Martensiomyces pterosporus]
MVEIKAKGILYDMDGTLVDTVACVERAWREKGFQHGIDGDELVKHVHGCSAIDIVKAHFPPECHTQEFCQAFELEVVHQTDGVSAVPGSHRALESVSPDKWAVVTAASRLWAETRLTQVGHPLPQRMLAAGDVKVGKPNPEGYLTGARTLGVDPKDVVIFEDAVNGVRAGVAAGATVIALLTSFPREELEAAGAKYIVKDFTSIDIVDCGDHITISF